MCYMCTFFDHILHLHTNTMTNRSELQIDFVTAAELDSGLALLLEIFPSTPQSEVDSLAKHWTEFNPAITFNFEEKDYHTVHFMAKVEGKPVGYICCEIYDYSHKNSMFWLCFLGVVKQERNLGYGKKLMAHAERFIANDLLNSQPGLVVLRDISEKRDGEKGFYERLGYKPTNTVYSADEWPDERPEQPRLMKSLNTPDKPNPV